MSFLLTTKKIINDWTDYNNHMNLSYYILLFDMGAEQMLSKFKMGEHSAKTEKKIPSDNLTFKTASLWGAQYESKT